MGLNPSQLENIANAVANGTKNASSMALANQQGQNISPFDVFTHTGHGLSERMAEAIDDPISFLQRDFEQEARVNEAMSLKNWESSSIDEWIDSAIAQQDALVTQLKAIGDAKGGLATIGASFQFLTSIEQMISTMLSVIPFPAFPAVRIMDMDIGLPHAHAHPPNLIPPAPPVPLPSTGPVIPIPLFSGASQTLINGMPAARCGDMGLGIWCGGYFPMYEIFLGSSSVWIEGSRAARLMIDITKHCVFTTPKPQDPPIGPMVGMTVTASPNVLIGGVPMPSLLSLGMGAAVKGLGGLLGKTVKGLKRGAKGLQKAAEKAGKVIKKAASKGAKTFSRATKAFQRALSKRLAVSWRFIKCRILRAEPVNVVTGEVVVDQQDFSIPGIIPIEWNRHYRSGIDRLGACGFGWETPADIRLTLESDGSVMLHKGSEGVAVFPYIVKQGSVMEFTDGAVLSNHKNSYIVKLKEGLNYHFVTGTKSENELLIKEISDQHGNYLRFERDSEGLKRIKESAGRYIEVKSIKGLIQEMRLHEPKGKRSVLLVKYEYSAETKDMVSVYDALDQPYQFHYIHHCCIQHTDRNGLSFYYEYDDYTSTGRCVHTWGDDGLYDYKLTYNPLKGETVIIDSLGHVSSVEYNDMYQVVKEVDPLNGVTLYEYDEGGRTSAVIDQDNNRTEYHYDDCGNLVELVKPDGSSVLTKFDVENNAIKIIDPNGAIWQQDWDEKGLLTRLTRPEGGKSQYNYNNAGQLVYFTNPMGGKTKVKYDSFGNLHKLTDALGHVTKFDYDMLGNVLSKRDAQAQYTNYEYDTKGQLLKVTLPSGSTISCIYDHEGNLTQYIDENGAKTRLEYFGQGEVKRRIQADGYIVEYHYDTEEQLIGVSNQRGERYQLVRDPVGRIIEEVDYWGQGRQYTYSGAGNLKESIDPLGRVISYKTDALGRIIKKVLPDITNLKDKKSESFEYDANGNLMLCENDAIRIERSFDSEGNLLEERQGEHCRINNAYDLNGNRVSRTIKVNIGERHYENTVEYQFDALDQAIGVMLEDHDPIEISRNALGQISKEKLSNNVQRDFDYTSDGYLSSQRVITQGAPLIEQDYRYDRAGNLIEKSDSIIGVDKYLYDPLGRITSHLDPENKLTEYLNDPAGDRLRTQVLESQSSKQDTSNWKREGEYEGLKYTFDRAGNLIQRSDEISETTFIWDANQRLRQSSTNDKKTRYQYDPLGRRLSKETDGVVTRFFWDGDALLGDDAYAEENKKSDESISSRLREWIYYPETFEPLLMLQTWDVADNELYIYHNDLNGCPTRLLSVDGEVVWTAQYTIWGEVDSLLVNIVDNPLRLQGQYEDSESKLKYNRHRYYDGLLGTYISQDPLGLSAGFNIYSLAINIIKWVDPLGLTCKTGYRYRARTSGTPDPGLTGFVSDLQSRGVTVTGTNLDIIDIRTGMVVGEVDVLTTNAAIQYKNGSSSAAAVIDQIQNKTEPFVDVPVVGFVEGAGGKGKAAQRTVKNAGKHVLVTNNIDALASTIK